MRLRAPFLPTFFICLGIVFAILVAVRIRSHQMERPPRPTQNVQAIPEPASPERETASRPAVPSHNASPIPEPARPPEQSVTAAAPPVAAAPSADTNRVVESVWFEPASIRSGTVEALHVRTFPKRDVKEISGMLLNGTARLPFQCTSKGQSEWSCPVTVGSCAACGRWKIERLKVVSSNGPAAEIPATQPPISTPWIFISADRCDTVPPVLHAVAIDASDAEAGDVVVTATVSDPFCDVASVTTTMKTASGETARLTGKLAGEGDAWAAHFRVTPSTVRAVWHVSSVEVSDEAGNVRTYSEGDPLLKTAAFELR